MSEVLASLKQKGGSEKVAFSYTAGMNNGSYFFNPWANTTGVMPTMGVYFDVTEDTSATYCSVTLTAKKSIKNVKIQVVVGGRGFSDAVKRTFAVKGTNIYNATQTEIAVMTAYPDGIPWTGDLEQGDTVYLYQGNTSRSKLMTATFLLDK